MTTFIWKVDEQRSQCLIHGFIHEAGKCIENKIIPQSIVTIIVSFYLSLLKQLKTAKNGEKFRSATFRAQGFKWYLEIMPNGLKEGIPGNFEFYLSLAGCPPKVKSIRVMRELELKESNTKYAKVSTYKGDIGYTWSKDTLKISDIQDLDQLTLSAKVTVLGVIDKDDNDITNEYAANDKVNEIENKIALPLKTTSWTWNITDPSIVKEMKSAKNKQKWKSDIFFAEGFRWFLGLYPNGKKEATAGFVNYFLRLAFIPPKVKQLKTGVKFQLNGLEKYFLGPVFAENKINYGLVGKKIDRSAIQDSDTISLKVEIEVYSVWDQDDNDITSQFTTEKSVDGMQKQEKYQMREEIAIHSEQGSQLILLNKKMDAMLAKMVSMEERMNNMESMMHEQRKENDDGDKFDNLINTMMNQGMEKLVSNASADSVQQTLKQWLQDTVKLVEYYDVFISNGIEDLETVKLLTLDNIKEIGIDKIGHQIKLLNEITKL